MKSIEQILHQAWNEIRDNHGVALDSVKFIRIDRMDGDSFMASADIDGQAVVPKKRENTNPE